MRKISVVIAYAIALATGPIALTQKAKPEPAIKYVCPMEQDSDVVEDKPGKCYKCGMTLVPGAFVYTCPVHAAITEANPGKCPIDGRDLVRVTMFVTWTCPGTSIASENAGKCPDGSAMTKKFAPRAHGNHNPQHGGQFFMDQDNWHHLEGAYPRAGMFRAYLYDDFTKPLKLAEAKQIKGEVVVQQIDPATHAATPRQSFPLVLAPNGRYLEGKIGTTKLPAILQAKVKFSSTARQSVFDFTFDKYTKDLPTSAPTTTVATPTTTPTAVAPAGGESGIAAPIPVGPDPGLLPLPIPETVPDILSQLRTRTDQIKSFIDRGLFGDVYVPAFQAKDLALALASHADAIGADRRSVVDPAIAKLVRASYLLDAFGDIGNKNQIVAAFAQFNEAEQIIQQTFPKQ